MFSKKIILVFYVIIFLQIIAICGCTSLGIGGSYGSPAKNSNNYYNKNFKVTNSKLKLGVKYYDYENLDDYGKLKFFIFFDNGFVLYDSYKYNTDKSSETHLKYSKLGYQDVGSYQIKNDTIFWGHRPGYMKSKDTRYYSAIIKDKEIIIITKPSFVKTKILKL